MHHAYRINSVGPNLVVFFYITLAIILMKECHEPVTETANLLFLGAAGGVEWGTVIVQVLTFIVLLASTKVYGVHLDVMDKRERDINRDIDDAEQAKLNAQNFKKKINKNLKEKQKKKFKRF